MSINNIGYQLANAYLQASFDLDKQKFEALLSEDVELKHTTDGHEDCFRGISEVMSKYTEKFFNVVNHIEIQKTAIISNGLRPQFKCKAIQERKENNQTCQIEFDQTTTLSVIREKGDWKISCIITKVSKQILI